MCVGAGGSSDPEYCGSVGDFLLGSAFGVHDFPDVFGRVDRASGTDSCMEFGGSGGCYVGDVLSLCIVDGRRRRRHRFDHLTGRCTLCGVKRR